MYLRAAGADGDLRPLLDFLIDGKYDQGFKQHLSAKFGNFDPESEPGMEKLPDEVLHPKNDSDEEISLAYFLV